MSDNAIQIDRVAKSFVLVELERLLRLNVREVVRRVVAVRDVSLSISHGQVYGFLGPNGAGKTTTIKMCMDLIRPSSGGIRVFGNDPSDRETKRRIGYLPEHPYFYDYLKPQEILDYFGRLFGLDRGERKRRVDRLLDRVGLDHARGRSLRKFSKGMLQRLGVASALLNDPDLLVFDEPLSGLDPMGRKEIRDIIIEEREKGKTIFFSSHILSDIEHLCDRVAIITEGVVRREGLLSDLLSPERRRSELLLRNVKAELMTALEPLAGERVEMGAGIWKLVAETDRVGPILEIAMKHGAVVDQVQGYRDTLEALFVRTAAETP